MPAPTVTVLNPPPQNYVEPGLLRPNTRAKWTGGTGPTYDVLHEWDTVNTFDSGNLIQDSNTGVSGPEDDGVPPSDMGPAGTTWYYRVTVTDNADSAFTTSGTFTLNWLNARDDFRRYLHLLANISVGFTPKDDPAGGWGPDPASIGPDGDNRLLRRYLHLLVSVSVGFDPKDEPAGGWGPDPDIIGPDGFNRLLRRYLHLLANVDATTPTPHIWYLFPTFGREAWEFAIIGYGFGDTQGTYSGTARLNALAAGIISWQSVAESASTRIIDPDTNTAEPIHQEIRATVPTGGQSGLVFVETDGP